MMAANSLTGADYRMLEQSWIARPLADAAHIRRVSSAEGAQTVGAKQPGDYAGLLFPYIWPGENRARDYRLRRDHPEVEYKADGGRREKRKYLAAPGGRNRLYFPPGVNPETLADVGLPIIITEGEKKTLALWRLADWNVAEPRFLPVGLSGVWNWRGTIGKEPGPDGAMRQVKGPIPDLARIGWREREVYLLFDSDKGRNPSIQATERSLAGELKSRGAVVRLVDLPDLPDQDLSYLDKTGADDFLAHREGGPERLLALIDGARHAEAGSASEILERSGILNLTAESTVDEVEAAFCRLRREMAGSGAIRSSALRCAAIKYLKSIDFPSPAQMLDAALAPQGGKQERPQIAFPEPEPWPYPVAGETLLDEIAALLRRFVVLPLPEIDAITLWIIHTYAVEATAICPILILKSAEKRCGKTLLMELLLGLVFRPLLASNITVSSLFRAIEKYQPTLLLDEADTFLGGNEELRGIINSGYRRSSAYVIRAVGEDFEPVVFNTFGPKAIAQIAAPPETIIDRGIVIEMRRKKPGERPERLRSDRIFADLRHLRQKAWRWTQDNLAALKDSEPPVPGVLHDRAQDSWRPLLAIAELAGRRWLEYGSASAVTLADESGEISKRTLLLADIQTLFRQAGTERLTSADICAGLRTIEEHPWPEWRDGQPITVRQLARLLEPLGIRPRQLRMGDVNVRGYELDDFTDSFARYLTAPRPDVQSLAESPEERGKERRGTNRCNSVADNVADAEIL